MTYIFHSTVVPHAFCLSLGVPKSRKTILENREILLVSERERNHKKARDSRLVLVLRTITS